MWNKNYGTQYEYTCIWIIIRTGVQQKYQQCGLKFFSNSKETKRAAIYYFFLSLLLLHLFRLRPQLHGPFGLIGCIRQMIDTMRAFTFYLKIGFWMYSVKNERIKHQRYVLKNSGFLYHMYSALRVTYIWQNRS